MKYVLATANPGKVEEMREILSDLKIEVVSRKELGIDIDVDETGTTFYENAKLKAEAICLLTGLPSIADDSGLIVDALGGEPGLYSSSYGGAELTSNERCEYLLDKMSSIKQRSAKFVSTIVCAFPDGTFLEACGECEGSIAYELHGTRGFGYDPVFIPKGLVKTMAQISAEEKNKLSHRGKALRNFTKLLISYYEGID